MIGDIISGIGAYFQAFAMIRRYRLWSYLWVSGLISLGIFAFIVLMVYCTYDGFGDWLTAFYPWETGREVAAQSSDIIAVLVVSLAGLMTFRYMLLIVVAPFMGPLSAKVEKNINPELQSAGHLLSLDTLREVWRGIRISLRNLWREIFLTLFLLFLSFIPGLAVITAPLIFCVQSYYAGFGNMDYTMERYLDIEDSVSFVRRNRGVALGNGAVFILILSIPVLGVFLAPTLATIAATREVVRKGVSSTTP